MNIGEIILLSIVQGVTELLPISSSAHLILTGEIVDIKVAGDILLISILHIGSTLAILLFYKKVLFNNFFSKEKLIFWIKILVVSIPTIVLGLLFDDIISNFLHNNYSISVLLIIVGIAFIVLENGKLKSKEVEANEIPFYKMALIGLGQSFALIPGTSRSGITIIVGMLCGIEKYSAFNFSFILAVPVLIGSFFYQVIKFTSGNTFSKEYSFINLTVVIIAIITTFLLSYAMLLLLKKFSKRKWLTSFGIYRIIIGVIVLLLTI